MPEGDNDYSKGTEEALTGDTRLQLRQADVLLGECRIRDWEEWLCES